ncbi:ribokinase [Deinococcus rubellus]|uniref:PfkB family carbohydrate kinase n=1 Tax=Deinococcus rubellus TaxID=1889240 RepID=UPI0031E777C0
MSESGVLFAGSLHVDRMVEVARLPVPGETIIATGTWSQLGGKATNQAVAAARHVHATLAACVGEDSDGRQAGETLALLGVNAALQVSGTLPTGSSVALLDASGENIGVVLPGANIDLRADGVVSLFGSEAPLLMVCQWETAAATLHTLLKEARQRGIPTLINAAPWQDDLRYQETLSLADHVVVNAVEAQAWIGTDPQARATDLEFNHPSVVVTLGAGGVLHYIDGVLSTDLRAPVVKARSSHGAGDHFVGVLGSQLARGKSMTQALKCAAASAADFVQLLHKHPSSPSP